MKEAHGPSEEKAGWQNTGWQNNIPSEEEEANFATKFFAHTANFATTNTLYYQNFADDCQRTTAILVI